MYTNGQVDVPYKIELGLERLVRSIIESSKHINDDTYDSPYITIIESWPYALGTININPYDKNLIMNKIDYSISYRKIALYYKLGLWSYRDVIWSQSIKNNNNQNHHLSSILKYQWPHPFWYHHLFFADLYSNILETYFLNCFTTNYTTTTTTTTTKIDSTSTATTTSTVDSNNDYYILPKILTIYNHSNVCNENIPYSIDITANKNFNIQNYNNSLIRKNTLINNNDNNDNYSSNDNKNIDDDVWKVYEERPNKYGFIDIFNVTDINRYQYYRSLIFNFSPLNDDMILTIEYLKTYYNAGLFDIYICDKKDVYATIDTLWRDYQHDRYSLTEIYILNLPNGFYNQCNRIKIVHKTNHCPISIDGLNENDECYVRTLQQKVKIISVKLCTQNK